MSKKAYLIGALATVASLGIGLSTGFYAGREHQRTLDVKVMEELKIPRPTREEPRTGNKVIDGILGFGQDAKQTAFDYTCAAYANETLEAAQRKVLDTK